MNTFEDWPYRWFGCWAKDTATKPSANKCDFVDPAWECPQRPRIIHYLSHSPILVFGCDIIWRTDGVWLWPDGVHGVAKMMEREHLRLPDAFVAHMASRNFEPMPYLETSLQVLHDSLDWPGKPFPPILKAVRTDGQKARRVRKFYATRKADKQAGRPAGDLYEWLLDRVGAYLRG